MPEPNQGEDAILEAARRLPAAEQASYLDSVCQGDARFRQRLESLLQEGAVTTSPGGSAKSYLSANEQPGDRIGRYRLLQQIGEGGWGVVYMAEQEEPVRRRVALKVIKLGMDTRQVVARFEAERQALALMDHPNIAKVLDAGATDTGRPFFVMELVRGIKITEYCDRNNVSMRDRLELFIPICRAIQHAHQKGIIHRDIKPSNVLVTLNDGVPVPKVIDFGIAKATEQRLTDKTLFTAFEQFIGTPTYMSPEQAEMSGLDIDTRTDVYSLGVLLYELLTGNTPFDSQELAHAGLEEVRRIIREKEPLRPSTRLISLQKDELTTVAKRRCSEPPKLVSLVRGDLDWIVMKCLEKDRTRRYETANGLAMDLGRYLDQEPVVARPPTWSYRLQKVVRRNKLLCGAGAAVAVALIGGLGLSTWALWRERTARKVAVEAERAQFQLRQEGDAAREQEKQERLRAQDQERVTRENLYAADMFLAQHALRDGNFGLVQRALDAHRPKPGEPGGVDLRGFEWRYLWDFCRGDRTGIISGHSNTVSCLGLASTGQLLASGSWDGTVKLWHLPSGKLIRTLAAEGGQVCSVAFSPDAKLLALGSAHGPVEVWEVENQKRLATLPATWANIAFCPAHTLLAVGPNKEHLGGNGTAMLWNYQDNVVSKTFPGAGSRVAVSPNGSLLAIGGQDVTLVKVDTGQQIRHLPVGAPIWQLTFSPDGQTLATTSQWDGYVRLFETASGRYLGALMGHEAMVWSIAWSSNGNTIATASADHTLRIWDAKSRQQIGARRGHLGEVSAVVFDRDGQTLFTGGKDQLLMRWNVAQRRRELRLNEIVTVPFSPLLSSDGKMLAAASNHGSVKLWDLDTAQVLSAFEEASFPLAFSADRQRLVLVGRDGSSLQLWSIASHKLERSESVPARKRLETSCLSADGALATCTSDGIVDLWEPGNLRHLKRIQTPSHSVVALALSAHSNCLALARSESSQIEIWDLNRGLQVTNLTGHKSSLTSLCFTPDDRLLASSNTDGTVKLWDMAKLTEVATLTGHKQAVRFAVISSDGKTLASGCNDGSVKLWNLSTFRELISFDEDDWVWRLGFSQDGSKLFFGSWKGGIRIVRAPAFSETDTPIDNSAGWDLLH